MAHNLLPEYHQLLRAAFQADERQDLYDVRSEVPESAAEWRQLCAVSRDANVALVKYVLQAGLRLQEQLWEAEQS